MVLSAKLVEEKFSGEPSAHAGWGRAARHDCLYLKLSTSTDDFDPSGPPDEMKKFLISSDRRLAKFCDRSAKSGFGRSPVAQGHPLLIHYMYLHVIK